MAIKYSKKLVEEAFENAYYVPKFQNKLIRKIFKIVNIFIIKKIRKSIFFIKNFYVNILVFAKLAFKKKKIFIITPSIEEKNYSNISKRLNNNGWVFIENFIDLKFYNQLLKKWPSNLYFKYKNNPLKNYLWGFEYLNNKDKGSYYLNNDDKKLQLFDELKEYYNFILSKSFKQFINKISVAELDFECISINSTIAKKNAFLIPHIDTIHDEKTNQFTLNCIHFIDGNNNDIEYSGGTGIYKDNEFQKKIFIPTSLKNSLLIYNSRLKFFHGFKKIKKNNFRKAIAFQFFSK